MRSAPKGGKASSDPDSHFKFMKSKEQVQFLTLTVIGATVYLSTQGKSKGYFLERILKKTAADLKSFFKELGLQEEQTKRRDRDSGEDVDDVFVYFPNSAAGAAIRKRKQQADHGGEAGEEDQNQEGDQE